METIYMNTENIRALEIPEVKSVIALGCFDGLHIGHQKVIDKAKQIARQNQIPFSIMSFFPHPKSVLNSGKMRERFMYLEPLDQKIQKLESMEVDYFYVVQFDKKLACIEANDFIENFVLRSGAIHIVCGFDYTYGFKAKGNVNTLQLHAGDKVQVTIVEKESVKQEKISSTYIRQCLKDGDVQSIPAYLGDYYSVKWCIKNGLLPYYSLPAPGTYKIILSDQAQTIKTHAVVTDDSKIVTNPFMLNQKSPLTISWIEKVAF